jgi:GAF domain-containing protein
MADRREGSSRNQGLPLGALVGAGDTSALISRSPKQLAIAGALALLGIAVAIVSARGALVGLPGVVFLLVVAGVAWFGRFVPGVMAVAASAASIEFFTLTAEPFDLDRPSAISLVVFSFIGIGISAAIGWQRSMRATEVRTRRRLQLLAEITDIVRARSGSNEALERLAEHVVPRVADWCVIQAIEGDDLVPIALAAADPAMTELGWKIQRAYPSRAEENQVVQTGAPIIVPELTDEMLITAARDDEHLQMLRELGLQSAVAAPLMGRDGIFGVMTLVIARQGWRYEADDLAFALELAGRASIAVDLVRALEVASEANRRASTLQRLSSSLATMSRVQDVFEVVVRDGVQAVGASAGLVALLDDDGSHLEVGAYLGYRPEVIEGWSRFPVAATTPLSEAVRERTHVVLRDVATRNRRFPVFSDLTHDRDHSLVCMPMIAGDEVIGGVSLTYPEVRDFTADDLGFLSAVMNQAGQALKRAALFEERDRTASQLQADLLPRHLAEMPGLRVATGYWPASRWIDVGGDFYDLITTPTGVLALIGDVCGRGPEAASLMGLARHTAHALAETGVPADQLLRWVSDTLTANIDDGRFVTMAAVEFRADGDEGFLITTVCAGHPLPLRFGSRGVQELGSPGMPLGLFQAPTLVATQERILAGEGLFLFTDGVSERHRSNAEPLDDEELMGLLGANDDPDTIIRSVGVMLDRTVHRFDDAAAMVLIAERG